MHAMNKGKRTSWWYIRARFCKRTISSAMNTTGVRFKSNYLLFKERVYTPCDVVICPTKKKRVRRHKILLLVPFFVGFLILGSLSREQELQEDRLLPDTKEDSTSGTFFKRLLQRNSLSSWIVYRTKAIPATPRPTVLTVLTPDCNGLIQHYPDEITFTKEMLFSQTYQHKDYSQSTSNCTKFRLDYGYPKYASSISESFVPLAYHILTHSNTIEQVERLLHSLYQPQHSFCIQIEKEILSSQFKNNLQKIVSCFTNIFIIPPSLSRLIGEQQCIAVIKDRDWKYLIKFNSTYFPLKSNAEIAQQILTLGEKNYIPSIREEHVRIPGIIYGNKLYLEPYHKIEQIKSSSLTGNQTDEIRHIKLYRQTSDHMVLSRAFMTYATQSIVASTLQTLLNKFGLLDSSTFWATLNALPKTPGGNAHQDGVFLNLATNNRENQYPYFIAESLGIEDLWWLSKSNSLFAYNFDIKLDHIVINCLEQWIQLSKTTTIQNKVE